MRPPYDSLPDYMVGVCGNLVAPMLRTVVTAHHGKEFQLNRHAGRTKQTPHVPEQSLLAHERHIVAALTTMKKAQGERLDIDIDAYCRIEQTGMEGRYVVAGGSRALGEQPDYFPPFETSLHLLAHFAYGMAMTTFDEHRARTAHQPADDRPMPYLTFGNEGSGPNTVDDENVDPGYVIGDP